MPPRSATRNFTPHAFAGSRGRGCCPNLGGGITSQRETTAVWERAAGPRQASRAAAALVIDAYFSGSKIRWILENEPRAREKARDGELLFGSVDTWLIWRLTIAADVTRA